MEEREKVEAHTKHEEREKHKGYEIKKGVHTLKEKVEAIEEQIKKSQEEYERLTELVEKLRIINTLLYKEVCKEYTMLEQPIQDEEW